MEKLLHLAETLYTQHTAELVFGMLACVVILMIINLIAVGRCRWQVRRLSDRTREYIKITMRQNDARNRRQRTEQHAMQEEREDREHNTSRDDEEVFGSVIQEMFS